MDFVGAASGATGGLGSDNGPILYSEPNRTSAIDDLRSVVLYIFIITIFLGFLLILPGVRSEKVPTFLCITTSLIVLSIILVSLFGTTWHVGQASISGPYKAFSKDRIQGELSVKIGLRSVNITLRAHKYYELHAMHPIPVILESKTKKSAPKSHKTPEEAQGDSHPIAAATLGHPNLKPNQPHASPSSTASKPQAAAAEIFTRSRATTSTFVRPPATTTRRPLDSASSLAEELLTDRGNADESANSELEVEEVGEVFASSGIAADNDDPSATADSLRKARSSSSLDEDGGPLKKRSVVGGDPNTGAGETTSSGGQSTGSGGGKQKRNFSAANGAAQAGQRYTIERSNVDINYNERFYWIEPDQMRHEHHQALERGLPYPILTVVEYLGQDEGGFSWSRQYRAAGYYAYLVLWLSFCVAILMFFLHCAAPKYGIYTMQCLGCLLLFTNFTYATLVPKGDHKLVIPFEGQSISLEFGLNYWLVLIGGCLSLFVGTLIVIIDKLFPNFIFTTILDVDFDSHSRYYKNKRRRLAESAEAIDGHQTAQQSQQVGASDPRPLRPPFLEDAIVSSPGLRALPQPRPSSSASSRGGESHSSRTSAETAEMLSVGDGSSSSSTVASRMSSNLTSNSGQPVSRRRTSLAKLINSTSSSASTNELGGAPRVSHLSELFVGPLIRRSTANAFSGSPPRQRQGTLNNSDSEMRGQLKRDSSVVEMLETSDTYLQQHRANQAQQEHQPVRVAGGSSGQRQHHAKSHGQANHYGKGQATGKNANLKSTDQQSRRAQRPKQGAANEDTNSSDYDNDDGEIRL